MAGRRYLYNSYMKYFLTTNRPTTQLTQLDTIAIDPQHNRHNQIEDVQKYNIPNTLGEMGTIGYQWNHLVNRKRTMSLKMPLCVGINQYGNVPFV